MLHASALPATLTKGRQRASSLLLETRREGGASTGAAAAGGSCADAAASRAAPCHGPGCASSKASVSRAAAAEAAAGRVGTACAANWGVLGRRRHGWRACSQMGWQARLPLCGAVPLSTADRTGVATARQRGAARALLQAGPALQGLVGGQNPPRCPSCIAQARWPAACQGKGAGRRAELGLCSSFLGLIRRGRRAFGAP